MHIFVMLPKMHASFEDYSLKNVGGDDYTSCISYNVIAGQSDLVKIKITVIFIFCILIQHQHEIIFSFNYINVSP